MPIEIEAKVRVEGFEPIVERLRGCGAKHVADMLETNIFFDLPNEALQRSDQGLRVRTIATVGEAPTCVMTFKGPRAAGPLKQREEIELGVADPDDAIAMLAALGYEPKLRFEKRRTRYLLNGCRVELDELPHLGKFVEVEGPNEEAIRAVQRSLGLGDLEPISEGYAALLQAHAGALGLSIASIEFDDQA